MQFRASCEEILKRIIIANSKEYAKNRNFPAGDITYLSPDIFRGAISVKQVADLMFARGYTFPPM